MPNALAAETSPYLLQHAHNPVDWHPWGEAAFDRARREQKLVFLSVGYSTCHWCHVMERESFENPAIAAVMNRLFINVKVDREERPDLDAAYMTFVQASTGQGGWPMSVWLTPDGHPIAGGTYFPPDERYGRPGFPQVCEKLGALWQHDRDHITQSAGRLLAQLRQHTAPAPRPAGLAGAAALDDFLTHCVQNHDAGYGGFGHAPKFPRPAVLRTLMQLADGWGLASEAGATAARIATDTLREIATGGIHDHLGGGFHRYSVDRYWHVPHYEKMLYDQAQLALAYLDAWQLTAAPVHHHAATGIFSYLLTTLRDAGGAFHAAEDADSLPHPAADHPREGAYWTWTAAEIAALPDPTDAALFAAAYGIEPHGNARPESDPHGELTGQNTLYRALPDTALAERFGLTPDAVATRLAHAAAILLDRRALRPPPHRDDKIITAWNGLAIAALARGARVLDRPELASAASAAANFLRENLWDGHTLYRQFRQRRGSAAGFPADAVFLISGLIELHATDPHGDWLTWAAALQASLERDCWDDAHAGFVMRPALAGETLLVIREEHDGAEPAPNHLAAENLLKLAILLDQPAYRERAETLLRAGTPLLESHPFAAPQLIAALDLHQRGVTKFQVPATHPAQDRLRHLYLPRAVFDPAPGDDIIVCEGTTCRIFS